jgi:four helix bundle protein
VWYNKHQVDEISCKPKTQNPEPKRKQKHKGSKTEGKMAKGKQFEDFEVWMKGRKITNEVYNLIRKKEFSGDFELVRQIKDACISITSNIAEGHERDGDKELIQFLSYAKGSAGEVRSQLYVALDQGYISKEEFDKTFNLLIEESRMLKGFMKYLCGSGYRGKKYNGS